MTTIQLRIDDQLKNQSKKILDKMGLDMTSAIKMYLRQIIATQGIPFQPLTENGLTLQQEAEILKASEEAEKGINVTSFDSWEEFQKHLDELKNED